ncbi:MAG TPA: DUF72 domain-containing protein [Acidimicrobiales bacterium]|nr:DUF72 domain-containing protein [Acidimicrobiales bacterium]
MPVLIGTSGWHYRHWRGGFYPAPLPARSWLEHYAQRFATVEVNSAFYRLPEAATFANWAAVLPDDFVVSVKASRYLTHVRRLRDPEEPVRRLMERASELGSKLGPVLVQLPPNLRIDTPALARCLKAFPPGTRTAVELRHESWFVPAARRVLEEVGAAACLTDTAGHPGPLWRTTDWGYLRFHGGRGRPPSCYGRAALATWARRLAELWPGTADVFVYFNNDAHGCAPRDARRFAAAVRRAGLPATRVPPASETPLT